METVYPRWKVEIMVRKRNLGATICHEGAMLAYHANTQAYH
jgi:hypothetical protein